MKVGLGPARRDASLFMWACFISDTCVGFDDAAVGENRLRWGVTHVRIRGVGSTCRANVNNDRRQETQERTQSNAT